MREIIEQYGGAIYAWGCTGVVIALMLGIIYGPFRTFVLQML